MAEMDGGLGGPNEAGMDSASLMRAGVQAARLGNRVEAGRLLLLALEKDPNNEMAWMWFASVAETFPERAERLEAVLKINPSNQRAEQELVRIQNAMQREEAEVDRPESLDEAFDGAPGHDPLPIPERPKTGPLKPPAAKPPYTPPPKADEPFRAIAEPTPDRDADRKPSLSILDSPVRAGMLGLAILLVMAAIALAIAPSRQQPAPTIKSATPTSADPQRLSTLTFAEAQRTRDARAALPPQATIVTSIPSLIAISVPSWTPVPSVTALPSNTPTQTPVPLTSLSILFVGEGRGRDNPTLYRVSAAGGVETILLDTPARVFDAAFSRDGRLIAYITDVNGAEQVAVANADGSGARPISAFTGKITRSPAWAPDGKRLIVTSNQTGNDELYILSLEGTPPEQITASKVNNRDPAWSPDGRSVVYASDTSGRGLYQIFSLDLESRKTRQFTESQNSSYRPSFSPDGSRIVFVSTRGRQADIYLMTNDGEDEQLLTYDDGEAENRDPSFSPDGRWIVFSSTRTGGGYNIFVMGLDGTQVQRVTDQKAVSVGPRFNPISFTGSP